jgi:hypothetical protein
MRVILLVVAVLFGALYGAFDDPPRWLAWVACFAFVVLILSSVRSMRA